MKNIPVILENLPSISVSDIKMYLRYIGKRTINLAIKDSGVSTSFQISLSIDFPECSSHMQIQYNCGDVAISDRIELRFLKTNLGKGCIAYFVCPISKHRCRKLYLYQNHFISRKAIKNCHYYDQTIGANKREEFKLIKKINRCAAIVNESQQPYFMPFYNGSSTKKHGRVLKAAEVLNASW